MRRDSLRKRGQSYSLLDSDGRPITRAKKAFKTDKPRLERELAELARRVRGAIYHPTERNHSRVVLSKNPLSGRVQFQIGPYPTQRGPAREDIPRDADPKQWRQAQIKAWKEMMAALRRIREGQGYRLKSYTTFEEYCQQRWTRYFNPAFGLDPV